MSWLGSFFSGAQQLGDFAKNAASQLGNFKDAVASGVKDASGVVSQVGNALNQNADKLDGVGLGGYARYAGNALNSGGQLGNAIGNFLGSNNINDAVSHGADVLNKGYNFGTALTGSKPSSPLTS